LVAAAVAQPPRNKQTRTNRFMAGKITNRVTGVKDGGHGCRGLRSPASAPEPGRAFE
jgi:hypothetical protein